jgi:hypothetical protein
MSMKRVAFALALLASGYMISHLSRPTVPLLSPTVLTELPATSGPDGKYKDFLETGKRALQEQSNFMAASVTRKDTLIRSIKKDMLVFSAGTTVVIHYVAEYSFGFDLRPGNFDIKSTEAGIELHLSKPILIGQPGIKSQSFEVPNSSVFISAKSNVLGLYQDLPKLVLNNGKVLSGEEAIVALCEKKLIAFLSDFLAKQPGIKIVPAIKVTYK